MNNEYERDHLTPPIRPEGRRMTGVPPEAIAAVSDAKGKVIGTAFGIADGWLLTAEHVATACEEGAAGLRLRQRGVGEPWSVEQIIPLGGFDIALLRCASWPPGACLTLAEDLPPFYSLHQTRGFPAFTDRAPVRGPAVGEPKKVKDIEFYESMEGWVDLRSQDLVEGMSGGPIVEPESGLVWAVFSWFADPRPTQTQRLRGLNWAVATRDIVDALREQVDHLETGSFRRRATKERIAELRDGLRESGATVLWHPAADPRMASRVLHPDTPYFAKELKPLPNDIARGEAFRLPVLDEVAAFLGLSDATDRWVIVSGPMGSGKTSCGLLAAWDQRATALVVAVHAENPQLEPIVHLAGRIPTAHERIVLLIDRPASMDRVFLAKLDYVLENLRQAIARRIDLVLVGPPEEEPREFWERVDQKIRGGRALRVDISQAGAAVPERAVREHAMGIQSDSEIPGSRVGESLKIDGPDRVGRLLRAYWIEPPVLNTRAELISDRARALGHELPDQVIRFIADRVLSNQKEIERVVDRIVGMSATLGRQVSIELAEIAIGERAQPSTRDERPGWLTEALLKWVALFSRHDRWLPWALAQFVSPSIPSRAKPRDPWTGELISESLALDYVGFGPQGFPVQWSVTGPTAGSYGDWNVYWDDEKGIRYGHSKFAYEHAIDVGATAIAVLRAALEAKETVNLWPVFEEARGDVDLQNALFEALREHADVSAFYREHIAMSGERQQRTPLPSVEGFDIASFDGRGQAVVSQFVEFVEHPDLGGAALVFVGDVGVFTELPLLAARRTERAIGAVRGQDGGSLWDRVRAADRALSSPGRGGIPVDLWAARLDPELHRIRWFECGNWRTANWLSAGVTLTLLGDERRSLGESQHAKRVAAPRFLEVTLDSGDFLAVCSRGFLSQRELAECVEESLDLTAAEIVTALHAKARHFQAVCMRPDWKTNRAVRPEHERLFGVRGAALVIKRRPDQRQH